MTMVGYDCPYCNGTGYEEVVVIRRGKVESKKADCSDCSGAGRFTNGKPDVYLAPKINTEWRG